MLTCCSYCLPATLLTSKLCSPLCLMRHGGTIAASLCCFAMVNYGRRHEYLPTSPDTREGRWRGDLAFCFSTARACALPPRNLSQQNRRVLCTLLQVCTCWNTVCIMKGTANLWWMRMCCWLSVNLLILILTYNFVEIKMKRRIGLCYIA